MAVRRVQEGAEGTRFVVLLSDANLRRYGVSPRALGQALTCPGVTTTLVMLASLSDEAVAVQRAMPPGSASICLDTAALPMLLKAVLADSLQR